MADTGGTDDTGQVIASAFPDFLAIEAAAAAQVLPTASHAAPSEFVVLVGGYELSIPYRIYNDEPAAKLVEALTPTQRLLVHTFYTRHHDGHVRQRNLEAVIGFPEPWIAPYIVQLVGEYVVEIIVSVARGLRELSVPRSDQRATYGQFAAENRAFVGLTAARVVSYWNEYYRYRYNKLTDYPGQAVLDELRSAASEYGQTP